MSDQEAPDRRTTGAPRLAYSPAEAAEMLGVGRATIYNLMKRGELRSVTIARTRRIPLCELERLAGLAGASGAE